MIFLQAEDGIRDGHVTGVQTCALPISGAPANFFRSTGLWPAQLLRAAVHQAHEIQSAAPIEDDQVQPASLDLRLGERSEERRVGKERSTRRRRDPSKTKSCTIIRIRCR